MKLPARDQQPVRQELDVLVTETAVGAIGTICPGLVKAYDKPVRSDETTRARVYVKDGFTYEVMIRCVAWPGSDELCECLDGGHRVTASHCMCGGKMAA